MAPDNIDGVHILGSHVCSKSAGSGIHLVAPTNDEVAGIDSGKKPASATDVDNKMAHCLAESGLKTEGPCTACSGSNKDDIATAKGP